VPQSLALAGRIEHVLGQPADVAPDVGATAQLWSEFELLRGQWSGRVRRSPPLRHFPAGRDVGREAAPDLVDLVQLVGAENIVEHFHFEHERDCRSTWKPTGYRDPMWLEGTIDRG
jgi:hypothetical protein